MSSKRHTTSGVEVPEHSCGTDDITFCMSECNNIECFRHPGNIIHKNIPHSFSLLSGTDLCPKEEEKKMIKAKFIGVKGSMGFVKDTIYKIRIRPYGDKFMLTTYEDRLFCPYDSMEAILRNWEIIQ